MTLLDSTAQCNGADRARVGALRTPTIRHRPSESARDPGARIRVGFVGGSDLIRQGLRTLVDRDDHGVVAQLVDLDTSAPDDVDVVLVDTPSCGSLATMQIRYLVALGYTRVLACGWGPADGEEEFVLDAGAAGYLSWGLNAAELVATLTRLTGQDAGQRGRPQDTPAIDADDLANFSRREVEILALICCGLSNQEIADEMLLSINTVKSYIRGAYRKAGVATRSCAVLWGIEHGVLRTSPAVDPSPRLATSVRATAWAG